ncbi:MAG TPA: IclR family transcriptional regulator [Terriglobales bacterium]|nr:IclR family transcriptional regulator [Terriglobales bacterium]
MSKETPATAVQRALAMLEGVGHQGGGMTNAEISRHLRIPKSSASYILRTLEHAGYLRRDRETGKYRLGLKVLSLSHATLAGLDLRELALPILRHLAGQTGLSAHLAILDHAEAVYIQKAEAAGFIKMDTWVGKRVDIHTTSVGKALVAFLPEEELEALLRGRHLPRRTPRSITSHARLHREFERVRAQGYAVDEEENSLGVRCVAAPVFDSSGQVEASVGVSGATSELTRAGLPRIASLVREAARRISRELGYRPRIRP